MSSTAPFAIDQAPEGEVLAIGCFASICRDALADELVLFTTAWPAVGVGVHEMSRPALLAALRNGDLSLAVLPGDPDPDFQSLALWQDEVMVALSPDDPRARSPRIDGADLADQVMLVSRQHHGSDMHRFLARRILPPTVSPPVVMLDLAPAPLLDRVARGDGATLLCHSHARDSRAGVVLRTVAAPLSRFRVHAQWRDPPASEPLAQLLDSLRRRSAIA